MLFGSRWRSRPNIGLNGLIIVLVIIVVVVALVVMNDDVVIVDVDLHVSSVSAILL